MVRLVHPFPSLLDGLVVGAVALVAGADPALAVRLGVSMTALQASIGALNDVVDAPIDAGRKGGKPIPRGLVSPDAARVVVVVAAGVGLVLAALSGPALLALAGLVLVIGYGYDLVAKGTVWSWLPFAIGIPILPVYGWYGGSGDLPGAFTALLPMAVIGGAALAIANARADLERDRAAGIRSIATVLGNDGAWLFHAALWVAAAVIGVAWLAAAGSGGRASSIALGGVALGALVLAAGVVLGRTGDPARRERAWQLEAVGAAAFGIAWLSAALA